MAPSSQELEPPANPGRFTSFFLKDVYHRPRYYFETVELKWNNAYLLSVLGKNYRLLPCNYESQWSGIYRLFSANMKIDRCCGKDPTGTLYLGFAGGGTRNWSILRTRIGQILRGEHQAIRNWNFGDLSKQRFPWESLSIEWAYTGKRLNYKGEPIPEAPMAENYLLACYGDSYGEFPPWNQKG
jgi:hypothetical protein